jgi:matrixin
MMNKFATIALSSTLGIALACSAQSVSALTINFDYTYDTTGFFTASRISTLEAAGSRITNRLNDNLNAITSSGANQFDANFSAPNGSGATTVSGANINTDSLTIYVGAQNFAGTTLAQAGPGGYSISGFTDYVNNTPGRGQTGAVQGSSATDFAPWGGAMSFDSGTNWYFDSDTSTTESFTGFDFYSVALHELGHVFGVGTADSWNNLVSGGVFTGSASNALFGGDVPLDASLGHWADGTTYNSQEAAMDPSTVTSLRKDFTELDFAALSDIGWEVTPVPVPPAFFLFASGLLGLIGFGKMKRK